MWPACDSAQPHGDNEETQRREGLGGKERPDACGFDLGAEPWMGAGAGAGWGRGLLMHCRYKAV